MERGGRESQGRGGAGRSGEWTVRASWWRTCAVWTSSLMRWTACWHLSGWPITWAIRSGLMPSSVQWETDLSNITLPKKKNDKKQGLINGSPFSASFKRHWESSNRFTANAERGEREQAHTSCLAKELRCKLWTLF